MKTLKALGAMMVVGVMAACAAPVSAQMVGPGGGADPAAQELFCWTAFVDRLGECEKKFKAGTIPLQVCCDTASATYKHCRDRVMPPRPQPSGVTAGGNPLDADGNGRVGFEDPPIALQFYLVNNPRVVPLYAEAWACWMRTHR